MKLSRPVLNAFTVDVEDYFHVTAFEGLVTRDRWDDYPSRVVVNTRRLLAILAAHNVQATFFILGWVACRFPKLVREIASAGHEIGCHSYWHRLIYQLTPGEFRDDLRQARDAIQDASGRPVECYRAPTWSITRDSLWSLEILAEEGIRADSSIFPIHHDRYGIPNAERFPHERHAGFTKIREFPPSVVRWRGLNVPVAGGGYFRLYPVGWTSRAIRTINHRHDQPFMFYIHPWELDDEQPHLAVPWRVRWRHYVGLRKTAKKLDRLLTQWRFGTMTAAWQEIKSPAVAAS